MPVFTPPHISDSTNRLVDRAVEGCDPALKPFFDIIRSGQPSNGRQLASDMNISVDVALSLYVRAIHAYCDTIRILEMDEEERQAILRWMSQPRSESMTMSFSEMLARTAEMDAA